MPQQQNHTLDLTDRTSLVASLPQNGIAAEIGVEKGEFSQEILQFNHPSKLFLIDCWEHQSRKVYGSDPCNVSDEEQEANFQSTKRRFENEPKVQILRRYSLQAAAEFEDNFFDWVYIDSNHLQIEADLVAWWPKVKPGGWLLGHDYCVLGDFIKVQPAVDQFVKKRCLTLLITREPSFPSWIVPKSQG